MYMYRYVYIYIYFIPVTCGFLAPATIFLESKRLFPGVPAAHLLPLQRAIRAGRMELG